MEYIIVLNADYRIHTVVENSNCFIEKFSSYQEAKEEAEKWKQSGDCISYSIYALCNDSKNYVV